MTRQRKLSTARYTGELAQPHVRIRPARGLLTRVDSPGLPAEEEEARKKNLEVMGRKMALLAEHFDAVDDEGQIKWKQLAIELAFAHVPGFEVIEEPTRKRGRPRRNFFDLDLYRAVLGVLDEGEPSVVNACRTLSKRAGPWKGANPRTLETRFHKEKLRAKSMDVKAYRRTHGLLGGYVPTDNKPSSKYPSAPPPLSALSGLGDWFGHKKE